MAAKHVGWAVLLLAAGGLTRALGEGDNVQPADPLNPAPPGIDYSGKADAALIEEVLYSEGLKRESASEELQRRRRVKMQTLMKVAVDTDAPSQSRFQAIRLLGVYRDRGAMQVLIRNLDWKYRDELESPSFLTGYPCAEALSQFGTECAVPVLRSVAKAKEDDITDAVLELRMHLLEAVYPNRREPWGRDDVVGVVERYIERIPEKSPTARRNVGRLLEKLKQKPGER